MAYKAGYEYQLQKDSGPATDLNPDRPINTEYTPLARLES